MSEDIWSVQASYKHGDRDQHMLNVRGADAQDLGKNLDELVDLDTLGKVTAVAQLLPGFHAAAPIAQSPYPSGQQAPAPAQQQPAPPAQPDGPAPPPLPSCSHGPKRVISKVGAKGRWYAYACPADQNDPTKCPLDFSVSRPHEAVAKFL